MPLRRRGIIYTLVALTMLAVIAAVIFTELRAGDRGESEAVEDRIRAVDAYLVNLDGDASRAARIAGFRAFIAMEQHIVSTGEYFTDPEAEFLEIFRTGNLSGTAFAVMENSSFDEYLARAKREAGTQGILFDVAVRNISFSQVEPWSVIITYALEMNVSDTKGTANWSTTRIIESSVPITDLKDPLFTKETFGRVQRVIRQTNVTVFVNDAGDANDTSGLKLHFNTTSYLAAGHGPDIMMRFEGNLSDSIYGIESLVDVNEISVQGLSVDAAASITDFEYFAGTIATACGIQNLTSAFRFDAASLGVYQIAGNLTYGTC